MRHYYEIQPTDVGASSIRAFGRVHPVSDFIGHIRAPDVGKRCYLSGDVIQVENDEQRDSRLARVATTARAGAHTPGPWKIEPPLSDGDIIVTNENGLRSLCVVHHHIWGPDEVTQATQANARLIAQAPAMLEALESMLLMAEALTDAPDDWPEFVQARAIVAAAKGE